MAGQREGKEKEDILAAVCDDDRVFGETFAKRVRQGFSRLGARAEVQVFDRAEDCCLAVERGGFGLVFLDIEMEGIGGFGAAKRIGFLREGRKLPLIVFVSAHESLVFDSYEFEPFWFMRKSRLEELDRVLERFLARMAERSLAYRFKEGRSYRSVKIRDILFLEGGGHTVEVNTYSNRFPVYGSLSRFEKELGPYGFFRIHRNFLVNMEAVFSVDKDSVTLADYTSLPVSKDRKAKVKERLLERV